MCRARGFAARRACRRGRGHGGHSRAGHLPHRSRNRAAGRLHGALAHGRDSEIGGMGMSEAGGAFLKKSRKLLLQDFLPKIERAVSVLNDDDIWWRPNDASNSVGNLLLHLSGNVTMWIVGGVGSRPFERNRQQEFDERTHISATELFRRLRTTLEFVIHILETIFQKSPAEAFRIMMHVHRNGRGIAGVYPFEVAETKADTVRSLAAEAGFPLRAAIEEA